MPTRVCVIGCGTVAPVHIKAIKALDSAVLYGVCDIKEERVADFGKRYDAKEYRSFENVIADKNIDSVHICTPHYLHASMAAEALEAGKHVVLEKPVCIKKEEIDIIEKALDNTDKKLCIMFQNRTNNSIVQMKNIIKTDSGIGKLIGISGIMNWHRDEKYYKSEPWRGRWETEGGGTVINQAVHLLDLIDYFGNVKAVRAAISAKVLKDIIETEDTADAYLTLSQGASATFYATNTFPQNRPIQLELCFENTVLRYADNMLWRIGGDSAKIIARDSGEIAGKDYWGSGHARVIRSFYDSIKNNTDDYISFEKAKHSARLLCAFYESAKMHKEIVIL